MSENWNIKMISDDVKADFAQAGPLLVNEAVENLQKEFASILASASAANALHNSRTLLEFRAATNQAFSSCAHGLTGELLAAVRAHDGVPAKDDMGQVLQLLQDAVSEARNRFRETFLYHNFIKHKPAFNWPPPGITDRLVSDYDKETFPVFLKIEVNLRRGIASMQKDNVRGAGIVNYGTIGAVSSGNNVKINVNQQISNEDKTALIAALDALINEVQKTSAESQSAFLEVIGEAESLKLEAAKPEPNKLRLTSGLQGVAAVVSAVGNAPAAYHSLKVAAGLIGIDLP